MRMAAVVDEHFCEAERSALRLDGDCFALGPATVVAGLPDGPRLRAASLFPVTARYDLVVDTWSAAWVHGAVLVLPRTLTLAVDVKRRPRTRAVVPAPREARYGDGDLERIEGVQVTTPLRTAVDLARFEPEWGPEVRRAARHLLRTARVCPAAALQHGTALRLVAGKDRLVQRLATLAECGDQPIETR